MPSSRQARSHTRYQRILDAALRVFSRRGYRDASVDEIAGAARTSKGGVYFHFPSKEAIFLGLLNRTAGRLTEKVEAAASAHDDPIARADAVLRAVLRTFGKHRALARLLMVEALGAGREFHRRMAEIRAEFASFIKRHLDTAVAQGVIPPLDTEVASRAWFGALSEVLTQAVLSGGSTDLERTYAALRPLLMRGVGIPELAGPGAADTPTRLAALKR